MHRRAVIARGVSKRFGATQALADVSMDVREGTIHAIVGQNGAGKSTLGKVIGGIYRPDSGQLTILGSSLGVGQASETLGRGVAMIHQELSLVPELSVAANVFLGVEQTRFGFLSRHSSGRFADLNARAGFRLDPDRRVSTLRVADRQKVEILRALARHSQVIVMDEPTSALSVDEARQLYAVMAWLRNEGRTVIYVSHFLDEVLTNCDVVTVMRDGRVVRSSPTATESKATLVSAMLGRTIELSIPEPDSLSGSPEPLLRVEHLAMPPAVLDVSLDVRPGEIVGLAGLVGSGRTEVLRAIFGVDRATAGTVAVRGVDYRDRGPRRSVGLGLGMIPEDRRHQGLVIGRDVRENVALPRLTQGRTLGMIDRQGEARAVLKLLQELDVTPQRLAAPVAALSGGNQQKVLFAKWITAGPGILLLDEPTRGIDIGAKRRIYELIVRLASKGMAILLVSSELEEVLRLSHRVVLISKGISVGEVDPRTTGVEEVIARLFGLTDVPSVA